MSELIEALRASLEYNSQTGDLRWRVALPRTPAGTSAVRRGPKGKLIVRFNGTIQYANRVAWMLGYGTEPQGQVLPKDGDFSNLRLSNLADVPHAEAARRQKTRKTNTSGVRGVSWSAQTGKWIASITKDYQRYHLGHFDTKEAAAEAYRLAEDGPSLRNAHGSQLPREPAYQRRQRWIGQRALTAMPALAGFSSYEQVVAECGAPPSADHVLLRPNLSRKLGPGNAEWRLPYARNGGKIKYNHAHLGISPTQYNRLLASQNGKCAICGKVERVPEEGGARSLVLDHDHETNAVRGILCNDCNRALGLLRESYKNVIAAAEYMRVGQFDVAEILDLCGWCQKPLPENKKDLYLAMDCDGNTLGHVCRDCEKHLERIYYSRPAMRLGDPTVCYSNWELPEEAKPFRAAADYIERRARSDSSERGDG